MGTIATKDGTEVFYKDRGVVNPEISAALRPLLADVFTLYLKTKNFHWHVTGPHFREYHLLLDEQAAQIFEMTDEIAERARKIGSLIENWIDQTERRIWFLAETVNG